jgi:hypothetical protein
VCSQQAGIPSGLQKTSLNDAPQIASLNTLGVWLRLSLTRNAGRRVKLLSRIYACNEQKPTMGDA